MTGWARQVGVFLPSRSLYEAVRLFCERAMATTPTFAVDTGGCRGAQRNDDPAVLRALIIFCRRPKG